MRYNPILRRIHSPVVQESSVLQERDFGKTLFAFGLNHKTAPVEVREKLYVREAELPELLELINETLSECLILSTCNRTEIYGVTDSADTDADYYKQLLIDFKGAG